MLIKEPRFYREYSVVMTESQGNYIPCMPSIGTSNPIVIESITTGVAKGYELIQENKSEIEIRCEQLAFALAKANEESVSLRAKVTELEAKLHSLETTPGSKKNTLLDAILTDSAINN